jgi:hypothetical protein
VADLDMFASANVTESFIDKNNKNKGKKTDKFGAPIGFNVAIMDDMQKSFAPPTVQGYTGCMSGIKLVYNPAATKEKRFRKSYEVDMFREAEKKGDETAKVTNPSGTFAQVEPDGRCGPYYKTPGTLPTVGPARQFATKTPGLDISVRLEAPDGINQAVLLIVAFLLAVVVLGILYLIYRHTATNHKKYKTEKERVYPRTAYVAVAATPASAAPTPKSVHDPDPEPEAAEEVDDTPPSQRYQSEKQSVHSAALTNGSKKSGYPESYRSTPASSHRSMGNDDTKLIDTDADDDVLL